MIVVLNINRTIAPPKHNQGCHVPLLQSHSHPCCPAIYWSSRTILRNANRPNGNTKISTTGILKDMKPTFRVKVRPSRPSGNNTVKSFLSSLTTTLKHLSKLYAYWIALKEIPLSAKFQLCIPSGVIQVDSTKCNNWFISSGRSILKIKQNIGAIGMFRSLILIFIVAHKCHEES